jgi:phosphoglycolate phosphatase
MRILLFDVDGTLLLTNGGGTRAIGQALREVFGISDPRLDVDYRGRTDSSILRELLALNGLDVTAENFDRLSHAYAQRLPAVLQDHGGRVLPGVSDLLHRLGSHGDTACYVMTGNLERTATQKLRHFGLGSFFRGIFGGDHDEDRRHLAERTTRTLRSRYGRIVTDRVCVIGDTPEDVRCGNAIGANVLAVCTGNFSKGELAASGADQIHDDLSDVDLIYRTLISMKASAKDNDDSEWGA